MPTRKEKWLVALIAVLGFFFVIIFVLPKFMLYTATVLHPDPQAAPSSGGDGKAAAGEAIGRARQFTRAHLSEHNLPGLSVAVAAGGDIVWAEGFGWADIERRAAVTPETRFRVGTASAALTSAAAGLLLEQGKLKLDEEIQTYVPEFPPQQWPVTLRQVMAHTAGLRSDGGDESPLYGERCARPAGAMRHLGDRPLRAEPETRYRFTSYGYIVVSAAVEAAAQQPFNDFMRDQVFAPLGMNDTVAETGAEAIPNTAKLYFPRYGADPKYGLHDMRPLNLSCYAGAMAFLSTPTDLVRFAVGINGGKLLKPETVQLLQASQRLRSGELTGYGLGWELKTVTLGGKAVQVVGHDGDSLGGNAVSLVTMPERGIVVAVMANISYADTFTLATKIAEAFAEGTKPAK